MPSLSSIARRLSDRARGTAFDRALAQARADPRRRFLFFWNRGLGDIPLGLVPLFDRIRSAIPSAHITVITREELRVAFQMTDAAEVHVLPGLQREARVDIDRACATLGLDRSSFTTLFGYPDPNRWLEGRRREFPPHLRWNPAWDDLAREVVAPLPGRVAIGAHVSSETAQFYGYRKDWPAPAWQALFDAFPGSAGVQWLLLGHSPEPRFEGDNLTDLRGRTSFAALMSVIRNGVRVLLAPDSGILTVAYYLDAPFDLDVISLWGDPRQGVLHQGCASPNPRLRHFPLLAPGEDIDALPVERVAEALRAVTAAPPR